MMLWRLYDVWTFTADVILFREIQCKKMGHFHVFSSIFLRIWLDKGMQEH